MNTQYMYARIRKFDSRSVLVLILLSWIDRILWAYFTNRNKASPCMPMILMKVKYIYNSYAVDEVVLKNQFLW